MRHRALYRAINPFYRAAGRPRSSGACPVHLAVNSAGNMFAAMFSKEEASRIRQQFWKTFGQYMSLHLSAEGLKVNWINYKTGIRHLAFRMDAGRRSASISIELSDPDTGMQELLFQQFAALKPLLANHLNEPWEWQLLLPDGQGHTVSRIGKELPGVNIFRREDWPAIISFLKPRLIALDAFWCEARYGFEDFR